MVKLHEIGKVVYCRYGRDYIPSQARIIKQHLDNPSLGEPLRQIATYLINIKRLVQDHNIDSDEFAKIKTKGKV